MSRLHGALAVGVAVGEEGALVFKVLVGPVAPAGWTGWMRGLSGASKGWPAKAI